MWNRTLVFTVGIIGIIALVPSNSFALDNSEKVVWQLVVISSKPACSGYHYYLTQEYNEITEKYLDLYQLENRNYAPECMTDKEYLTEYEKPRDLDLVILVYDRDKGEAELHTYDSGGIYMHQGDDLSTNHTIIICDCANFYFSYPVWILSHELSHFVLNYLGFDLSVVEDEIHKADALYDHCIEVEYDSSCSSIKTRIETYRAYWTVMTPYEPAIGKSIPPPSVEKITFDNEYQTAMMIEITNWWLDGQIADESYVKSLQILSGKTNEREMQESGFFAESPIIVLTEPPTDNKTEIAEHTTSPKLREGILEMTPFAENSKGSFSAEDQEIFLQWLETKAHSWNDGNIRDDELITELEYLLNSPTTGLYLNYLDSLSVEELITKGMEFAESGEYRNAISYYDRAIVEGLESEKIETDALLGKGSALNALGLYEDALRYFDDILETEPENIDALKKKAFTLAQLGHLEEAIQHFKLAKHVEAG